MIGHFSSRGPTRVLRSTSSCIPRPRRRRSAFPFAFQGEPTGATARSAGSLPTRRRMSFALRGECGTSPQGRLAEPVIARVGAPATSAGPASDAPRPAPARDTVRQRSWPGGELIYSPPLRSTHSVKSKTAPQLVAGHEMHEPILSRTGGRAPGGTGSMSPRAGLARSAPPPSHPEGEGGGGGGGGSGPPGGVSGAGLAAPLDGAGSFGPAPGKGAGPARPAMGGGVESCTTPSCPSLARALNVGRGVRESGHERLHRGADGRGGPQLERRVVQPSRVALRQDAAPEAELRRLRQALLDLADSAHLTPHPHFAE